MQYFALKYFRVRTRNFQAVILFCYSDYESFCHNIDPKEAKSINRFKKKETFIPDKHTGDVVNTQSIHRSNQSIHWFPGSELYLICRIILDLLCFFS